ncbi:ankyrin repeat domain-containing protein, partial [Verrucomicrobia bacterium]|nr:ankyrin repeat domain-containing protein [Verrucomicrobiota bacterium]
GEDVGTPPLHIAALVGSNEIVELLITKGADVNAKEEEEGWTPLFVAVGDGYKKIIELLIANGADVNAKDDVGDTPLDMAIGLEQPETVDLLRKHGGKTGEELKAEGK